METKPKQDWDLFEKLVDLIALNLQQIQATLEKAANQETDEAKKKTLLEIARMVHQKLSLHDNS